MHCLFFWVCILGGTLTKAALLPFAVCMAGIFIFKEWEVIFCKATYAEYKTVFRSYINVLLLVVAGAGLFYNVSLYGGNYIQFGNWLPSMEQVLPVEDCLKYRLFARNYAANQYKAGTLSKLDAQRIALQARDPGDRGFALNLIEKAFQEKQSGQAERMGRVEYTVEWFRYVFARTYGVAAHNIMNKSQNEIVPYYIIFILAGLLGIGKSFRGNLSRDKFFLLVSVVWYAGVLMHFINYANYLHTGFVGLALTGRYIFPVIVPFYILIAYGLMDKMPNWWQWGVGGTVSAFFIYGDFPWFLQNVTPDWYF